MKVTVLAIEHSMCEPSAALGDPTTSPIFLRPLRQVPVIHIFGYLHSAEQQQQQRGALPIVPTPAEGAEAQQRRLSVCVHLHGVFPYFFVPCLDAAVSATQFAAQLEAAAIAAFKLPAGSRLVHHVARVEAIPFYGFCEQRRPFFKIFVVHPSNVAKLANLLGSSAFVGGRRHQPYEAHLPYLLQFMADTGVTGCGVVDVTRWRLREPPAAAATTGTADEMQEIYSGTERETTMAIEADAELSDFQVQPVAPGSSLGIAIQGVRRYLAQSPTHRMGRASIEALLQQSIRDAGERTASVAACQASDPIVAIMRSTMRGYLSDRAGAGGAPSGDSGGGIVRAATAADLCVAPTPEVGDTHTPALPDAATRLRDLLHLHARAGRDNHDAVAGNADADAEAHLHSAELDACPTYNVLELLQELGDDCPLFSPASSSNADNEDSDSSSSSRSRGVDSAPVSVLPAGGAGTELAAPNVAEVNSSPPVPDAEVREVLMRAAKSFRPESARDDRQRSAGVGELPLLSDVAGEGPERDGDCDVWAVSAEMLLSRSCLALDAEEPPCDRAGLHEAPARAAGNPLSDRSGSGSGGGSSSTDLPPQRFSVGRSVLFAAGDVSRAEPPLASLPQRLQVGRIVAVDAARATCDLQRLVCLSDVIAAAEVEERTALGSHGRSTSASEPQAPARSRSRAGSATASFEQWRSNGRFHPFELFATDVVISRVPLRALVQSYQVELFPDVVTFAAALHRAEQRALATQLAAEDGGGGAISSGRGSAASVNGQSSGAGGGGNSGSGNVIVVLCRYMLRVQCLAPLFFSPPTHTGRSSDARCTLLGSGPGARRVVVATAEPRLWPSFDTTPQEPSNLPPALLGPCAAACAWRRCIPTALVSLRSQRCGGAAATQGGSAADLPWASTIDGVLEGAGWLAPRTSGGASGGSDSVPLLMVALSFSGEPPLSSCAAAGAAGAGRTQAPPGAATGCPAPPLEAAPPSHAANAERSQFISGASTSPCEGPCVAAAATAVVAVDLGTRASARPVGGAATVERSGRLWDVTVSLRAPNVGDAPPRHPQAATEAVGTAHPSMPMLTTVTPPGSGPRVMRGFNRRHVAAPERRERSKSAVATGAGGTARRRSASSAGTDAAAGCIVHLKIAAVDVIGNARRGRVANPFTDPVLCVCVAVTTAEAEVLDAHFFAVARGDAAGGLRAPFVPPSGALWVFGCEAELLGALITFLQRENPDVITGWDVQRMGLGYLTERARIVLRVDLLLVLSRLCGPLAVRVAGSTRDAAAAADSDEDEGGGLEKPENREQLRGGNFASSTVGDGSGGNVSGLPLPARQPVLRIAGRIVLSLWKITRSELKLKSYTMGAVAKALFGVEMPVFADDVLGSMMRGEGVGASDDSAAAAAVPVSHEAERLIAMKVLLERVTVPLRIARKLDLFVRTSELAQLYGILFVEVLSRGSQFRVESMLLRFTKPLGYLTVSPSKEQVMRQNRQEGMALVMEPYSGYYRDPVVVLDFRSLYPSIVCAYNLCFCTCLGKISPASRIKIGALPSLRMPASVLEDELHDAGICFAPNSCMFAPLARREGVLPMMLQRILNTRFQVQAAMKLAAAAGHEEQRRVFDAQQLGLKLLANVTYGYAAATFTGRMPCSDVADSIVLLARATLERAIRTIEGNTEWGARVIYGDTDSLFVLVPGATRERAFAVGRAIVHAVTASNPAPVTLKLEKVYQPCLMVVKKRYVGYAYESPDQQIPKFDAKGIETVRRDQCLATAKITEQALRLLFDTNDAAAVRRYFVEQVHKLQRGDMAPTELVLRREVKLGTYAKDSALPPGARVALQQAAADAAALPAYGERVPYLVVNATSDRLMDQVQHPQRLLTSRARFTINAAYYIEKHIIASLERLLHLAGIDVRRWYEAMPKVAKGSASEIFESVPVRSNAVVTAAAPAGAGRQAAGRGHREVRHHTIDEYFQRVHCAVCRGRTAVTAVGEPPLCGMCLANPGPALLRTRARRCVLEWRLYGDLFDACGECSGASGCHSAGLVHAKCLSVDCELPFHRLRLERMVAQLATVEEFLVAHAERQWPRER